MRSRLANVEEKQTMALATLQQSISGVSAQVTAINEKVQHQQLVLTLCL